MSSCEHEKNGEIVMDKDGVFYILHDENGLMPKNAYRLTKVDTNKYNVKGFNTQPK